MSEFLARCSCTFHNEVLKYVAVPRYKVAVGLLAVRVGRRQQTRTAIKPNDDSVKSNSHILEQLIVTDTAAFVKETRQRHGRSAVELSNLLSKLQGKASTSYVYTSEAGRRAIPDPLYFCCTDVLYFRSLPITISEIDTCTSVACSLISQSHACHCLTVSAAAVHIKL